MKTIYLEEKEDGITKKKLEKEVKEKELLLKKVDSLLAGAPEGRLTYQTKNGRPYYYYLIKKGKIWRKTYIKKKDRAIAEKLAQKEYFEEIKNKLNEQIHILAQFLTLYNETALEQVYRNLPEERKQLIKPLVLGTKEKMQVWNEEIYEPYDAYSEHKIYETIRGEMVRSKSEVIIANMLYQYRKDIDYKYERPLTLIDKNGKEVIVHPDFTIINKHTARIYYYEHAGKMDDSRYATDFVKKMELYVMNNIIPGKDLLISYETSLAPLSISYIRKLVEKAVEE